MKKRENGMREDGAGERKRSSSALTLCLLTLDTENGYHKKWREITGRLNLSLVGFQTIICGGQISLFYKYYIYILCHIIILI